MKDLEWLKRSIDKRIKTIESDDITFVGSEYYDEGYIDGMRDVLYRIDQLDEPEVLSQELPVIPKFVADWIKEMKQEERPLYSVMSTLMNKTNHEWSVWKSANKNFSEVVAQAWLNGYEIEPEPQYRLKAGENYLYFNLDGTVRGSTKKNAAITKEHLEKLPFDVEMAVLSGIIEVEELEE